MVSRCTYLNIILQTRAPEVLVKFIDVGGYKLLNSWLTYSKTTNNTPLLQQILLTLQHLPLTVDHHRQMLRASWLPPRPQSMWGLLLAPLHLVNYSSVCCSLHTRLPAPPQKSIRAEVGGEKAPHSACFRGRL